MHEKLKSGSGAKSLLLCMQALQELFLPQGFPNSVTPDYLSYQLWSVPTHITVRNQGGVGGLQFQRVRRGVEAPS